MIGLHGKYFQASRIFIPPTDNIWSFEKEDIASLNVRHAKPLLRICPAYREDRPILN